MVKYLPNCVMSEAGRVVLVEAGCIMLAVVGGGANNFWSSSSSAGSRSSSMSFTRANCANVLTVGGRH